LGAEGKTWPETSELSPVIPGGGELEGDSHAPSIDADRACVNPPPGSFCKNCSSRRVRDGKGLGDLGILARNTETLHGRHGRRSEDRSMEGLPVSRNVSLPGRPGDKGRFATVGLPLSGCVPASITGLREVRKIGRCETPERRSVAGHYGPPMPIQVRRQAQVVVSVAPKWCRLLLLLVAEGRTGGGECLGSRNYDRRSTGVFWPDFDTTRRA